MLIAEGGNNTIYGSALGDSIATGAGDDVIDGFEGADSMIGGEGQDTYYVDNAKDYVKDTGGNSIRSFAFINYDLSD